MACPHTGCSETVKGKALQEHTTSQCPYRYVRCECGFDVLAHEIELHAKDTCLAALRSCSLGCGKKVRLNSFSPMSIVGHWFSFPSELYLRPKKHTISSLSDS